MRILRDAPISRKLTVITMLTVVCALLLTCAALLVYELFAFRTSLSRDLGVTARMIGFNTSAALSFDDADSAAQTLKSLSVQPHVVRACVYDAQGEVFAIYRRDANATAKFPSLQSDGEHFGPNSLELFGRIELAGEAIGTIYLQSDLNEMGDRLKRYAGIALAVVLVSIAAAFLLSSRLQRIVSEPLSRLALVLDRVAEENDYSVRAVKQGDGELGRLIEGFNHMLAQIETRDAALKSAHDHLEKRVEERTLELKQAQEETTRERARFKFIFESLPVGISWMLGGQIATRLVNPSHARLTGVPMDRRFELECYRAATHPEDRARQDALRAKLFAGEIDSYTMEKRYVLPDGSTHWVEITVRIYLDANGGETQEIGTFVDLTERKRAEEKLANSLSVLHATFQSTIDGILVVDKLGQVTAMNQKFADIWKIPADVMAARDDWRMVEIAALQLKEPARFTSKVRELYATPEAESFDTLNFSDGRVIERVSQPQRVDGMCVGRVWFFRDITERKRAEAQLESAHRRLLETSRQAGMAEVATGVLHNVGNVLNSVNVSSTLLSDQMRYSKISLVAKLRDLLRDNETDLEGFIRSERGRRIPAFLTTLSGELENEQTMMLSELEQLRKNIEHIKEIVAMQQQYAKVSGVAERVSVSELVEDALRMNAGALIRHEVSLIRDFRSQPIVTVEKHKVLQILINLLRNAKYACDESGREDKQIVIHVTEEAGRVRISVIDNGVGIPTENLTRIFAHGFTTRKEGHGFGLHSGALAAKDLGGVLTVFSEGRGRGAKFTLELPIGSQEGA